MTDTLKRLAERFPSKFAYHGAFFNPDDVGTIRLVGVVEDGKEKVVFIPDLTSDDYDEMAGLLGYEFEVVKLKVLESWDFRAWPVKVPLDVLQTDELYPTKRLASIAAFQAIAERELSK